MIIIKYIVLALVLVASFSIGNLIAKKYVNRVKELKEMKNALNMFETKIRFTYSSVPEIFEDISKHIDRNIGKVFKVASEKMKTKSAGEAWNESIDLNNMNLINEDKIILKNLGKLLGKTDVEGQISEIKLVSKFLDTQIELAENEQKKNEKMYKTLGGIVGLTIVIILI